MASEKPVIHGRDHLPGHADPIPGLEELIAASAFVHAEGRYQITGGGSVTIAASGSATIDWAYISGDPLLDLTNPAHPAPVVSGWYTVDATYAATTGGTAGAGRSCKIEFHGAQSKHAWDTHTIGSAAPNAQAFVSLSGHLRTGGDYIALILGNLDSGSNDLTLDTIEVSMVYATTP